MIRADFDLFDAIWTLFKLVFFAVISVGLLGTIAIVVLYAIEETKENLAKAERKAERRAAKKMEREAFLGERDAKGRFVKSRIAVQRVYNVQTDDGRTEIVVAANEDEAKLIARKMLGVSEAEVVAAEVFERAAVKR